ncbi:MAG: RCC1 domain-containing protein, partial [Planctomycetota bacterium]
MRNLGIISFILMSAVIVSSLACEVNAGSLAAWGQGQIPGGNDFADIAAGYNHSLAVESDGSLQAWGDNDDGQCDVPDSNNFETVAAGGWHSVALKSDGSLDAWGYNTYGQCDVSLDTGFTAVAAGWWHSLALKSDGT